VAAVRAVLFDLDGTLLDTCEDWVAAFNASLALVGASPLPLDAVVRWIGTPFETILARAVALPEALIPRVTAEFNRREAEWIRHGVRTFPGVPEMIAGLGRWRLAAVSNKRTDTAREVLQIAGLAERFDAVVGGDAVSRKKPAPDPVLKAAELLEVPAGACVLVGDTENDVLAGKAAGARTVGVTWGYGGRARLEAAGVDHLIEAPGALAPLLRALTPSTAT